MWKTPANSKALQLSSAEIPIDMAQAQCMPQLCVRSMLPSQHQCEIQVFRNIICISLDIRYPHANDCCMFKLFFFLPHWKQGVVNLCKHTISVMKQFSLYFTLQHSRNEQPVIFFYRKVQAQNQCVFGSVSYCLLLEAAGTDSDPDSTRSLYSIMRMSHSGLDCERAQVDACFFCFFSLLMLMRLCWNPWVKVELILHCLFHVWEPLQTFKLIIYLRTSCLPCQAAALLLVPACALVYIFATHKANHVLIFQIRKANKPQSILWLAGEVIQHWEIINALLLG